MPGTVVQLRPVRLRCSLGPGFPAGGAVTAHGTHEGLVVVQAQDGTVAHVLPDLVIEEAQAA